MRAAEKGLHVGFCVAALALAHPRIAAAQSVPDVQSAPPPPQVPPQVPTPPDPAVADLQHRSDRLHTAFEKLADDNRWSGWTTAGHLINGVLWLGIGAVVTFVKDDEFGSDLGRAVAATGSVLIGAPSLALGIRGLSGATSVDEDRFVRFERARAAGRLSPTEVARYEGELREEAEYGRKARITGGVAEVGLAAGGATLIAFAATSPSFGDARYLVYVEGGWMLLIGTIDGISKLTGESAGEREWRSYQHDVPSEPTGTVRIGFVPAVSPRAATFSVVAEF
jgi:hypothetical protein